MVLPYTRFKYKQNYVHKPMLDVKLSLGARSVVAKGLLDTGSDTTLINKAFGKDLDVDFKQCRIGQVIGISSVPQRTWVTTIELEVENLTGSRKAVEVEFIDSPTVGILLGHRGFFENFMVKFESYFLMFEINHKQT